MIRQIELFRPTPRSATGSCSSTTTTSRSPGRCTRARRVAQQPPPPPGGVRTSGMKAALNGGLNLSILDGWWHEMFDGENGWAISSAENVDDLERRDQLEAVGPVRPARTPGRAAVLRALRRPVPRRWLKKVRKSLASLGPRVTAPRMVADYVAELYEPTAARRRVDRRRAGPRPGAGGVEGAGARAVARRARRPGRRRPVGRRPGRIAPGRGGGVAGRAVGRRRRRAADPRPGRAGRRADPQASIVSMDMAGPAEDNHARYTGSLRTEKAGRYGFTARVPCHPDLVRRPRWAWPPGPEQPPPRFPAAGSDAPAPNPAAGFA